MPLFFTADYEWGVGTRASNFTELPAAMAYGAADSEALAEAGGAVTALEARAQGINVLFAPVADVNNNPANPIINTRSFGEDPQRVGELAGGLRARRPERTASWRRSSTSPATATPTPTPTSPSPRCPATGRSLWRDRTSEPYRVGAGRASRGS